MTSRIYGVQHKKVFKMAPQLATDQGKGINLLPHAPACALPFFVLGRSGGGVPTCLRQELSHHHTLVGSEDGGGSGEGATAGWRVS
jgi:hypothetical protein